MQKTRIIHVVHDFLFGGIESYLYYLAQAQQQNPAIEIAILCCQAEDKVANPRLKTLGIKIYYVPVRPFDLDIRKYSRIRKIVSGYDIAQLHIYKPLLLEALSKSTARVVFTVHTAGAVRREQSAYAKLKVAFQVKQLNRCCLGIVNNSNYSQAYWLEKGVKKINNEVIYNGVRFYENVDHKLAAQLFPALAGHHFIIGTTSRFIGWKRVDYLINAFAKVQKENAQAKLLLVGDGTEMPTLKALVKDLAIEEAVIFTGFQKQVASFQSVMNVCVFPSVSEPFGLVAIECMHLGKPVLVMNDGGGLRELVEQIEPAHIADGVDELAKMLLNLANQQQADQDAQNKRKAFAEKFNVFEIEKQYFSYYKSLYVHG